MTTRTARILATVAFVIHVVIVISIVRQPLDANSAPRSERSLIWPLHVDTTHRRGPGADFFGVYAAGIQPPSKQGIYVDISDPHTPVGVPYGYPFRYLPVVSDVLSPVFRLLPPRTAYVTWILVVELVCFASIVFFWRRAPDDRFRALAAAALLASTPYFLELTMGQFTFFTIALMLGALAVLDERPKSPGGWIAFVSAATLKLFPLVVAPAVLRKRGGWKVVAATLAFIVATSAIHFALHPTELEAFMDINTGGKMDGLDAGNHGLLYIVHRATRSAIAWRPPPWTKLVAVWQLGILALTAGAVFFAKKCDALFGGAILVIAFVLSYVHVWEHHYSATILAALAILMTFLRDDGRWSPRVKAVAASTVLLALPTPFVLLDPHPDASVWDPAVAWGVLAFLPPLCKVLPSATVLFLALRSLAQSGFALPDWLRRRSALQQR